MLRRVAPWLYAAEIAALDVAVRGGVRGTARAWGHEPRLVLATVASIGLWWLVGDVARTRGRPARWLAAASLGALVAIDALVYRWFHVPLDAQVVRSAVHAWRDVAPVLIRALPLAAALAAMVTVANVLLLASAGAAPHARRTRVIAACVTVVAAVLGPPFASATPELRVVDAAIRATAPREAAAASSAHVPEVVSARGEDEIPSVLFILTESVRAEDACSGHGRCATTPRLDALLPDRAPLRQMRAVSSYTAVSFAALLTGRAQAGSREDLASAPTMFDLVRAVRTPSGARPTIAYWSAQSDTIFEREPPASIDSFVSLETLTGRRYAEDPVDTGFDRLLFAKTLRDLPTLKKPYFLFLHVFGTHAPYFVDEANAPFAPWSHTVSWSGMPALLAAYRDAMVTQDAGLADVVRAFREAQGPSPWAIVYTSDHGEAFGEHGAIHHGQDLYEEQIHVPAFVASSDGSAEKAAGAWSDRFVTHLDVLPTVLDLYGVYDALPLAPVRARLDGRSLLRAPSAMPAPLPITNCTGMFPCPVNAWGVMQEDHVLEAQVWDPGWRCMALVRDGELAREEPRDMERDEACTRLRDASRRWYETLPNREPNRQPLP